MVRSRIGSTVYAIVVSLMLALFASGSTASASGSAGAVYTLTNAPSGNTVLAWDRATNGTLTPAGSYATGGLAMGLALVRRARSC